MGTDESNVTCLVIQLGSQGDTLQSLMALRAAKQLYPQLEIHLVVREECGSASKRVPWIEGVHLLSTSELVNPVKKGIATENDIVPEVARWVRPLVQHRWDFIVNWSFSPASSYLTALLPAGVKLGYSRRDDETFTSVDEWSGYVQGVVKAKVEQNIHITDIMTTQLLTALQMHVGEPMDRGEEPVTSKGFFRLDGAQDLSVFDSSFNAGPKKWVGVQMSGEDGGASWSVSNWEKLVAYVLRRHAHYNVVLLGRRADLEKARRFQRNLTAESGFGPTAAHRVISLVGKTDFSLLAAAVANCQWVISTNSPVVQLASVLGTRVLNLALDSESLAETGPYGNGHYVVSPNLWASGTLADSQYAADTVSPEVVYAAWSYAASEWSHQRQKSLGDHFQQLGWAGLMDSARVLRSKIRPTRDGGGVVYESLLMRNLRLPDWTSIVLGQVARHWFCGWVAPLGQEIQRNQLSPELLKELRELRDHTYEVLSCVQESESEAVELARICGALRSDRVMNLEARTQIKEIGDRIQNLDKKFKRLSGRSRAFTAFSQMLTVMLSNLRGANLSEVSRESADAYHQIGQGVAMMRDWLDHTLRMARPLAIQGGKVVSIESAKKEL